MMMHLKKIICMAIAASGILSAAGDYPAYVGAGGGMLLPGNGNSLERAAEATVLAGIYADDFLAYEIAGSCAPNASSSCGNHALSGVALRALFHLAGCEAFDKLFGCERFDPFVTLGAAVRFGAAHAFAEGSHRTAMGPLAGIGAFYHLTENLDLRADAQAMLGVDSPAGMMYSVVVGIQWNFGGSGE